MPSGHVQLCSTSGAHPDIACKVLRAFPAARRQLRRIPNRHLPEGWNCAPTRGRTETRFETGHRPRGRACPVCDGAAWRADARERFLPSPTVRSFTLTLKPFRPTGSFTFFCDNQQPCPPCLPSCRQREIGKWLFRALPSTNNSALRTHDPWRRGHA